MASEEAALVLVLALTAELASEENALVLVLALAAERLHVVCQRSICAQKQRAGPQRMPAARARSVADTMSTGDGPSQTLLPSRKDLRN